MKNNKIGVLLVNLGTPDAPTPKAVRKYLKEFLSDPRVVEIPRLIWWIILYGIILPLRSFQSAKLYQKIWLKAGSPLRVISEQLTQKLQLQLGGNYKVILGMRYGKPSLKSAVDEFEKLNIQKILILPLYPQYSAATTATTFDRIAEVLCSKRVQPEIRKIRDYHDYPDYIQAIAETLRSVNTYETSKKNEKNINNKKNKILFSFHGLPQKCVDKGDIYFEQCHQTANLIAKRLELLGPSYLVSFQSRLGRAEWLKPYTDKIIEKWAEEGVENITVVSPGFPVDCLETLEEINIRYRELFLSSGGKSFHYISALNDSDIHINMLQTLIHKHTTGWL